MIYVENIRNIFFNVASRKFVTVRNDELIFFIQHNYQCYV